MRDLLPPGQRRDSPCRGGTVPPPHCVGASTPLFFSPRRKEKRRGRWKRKGRLFLTNSDSLDHSTGFSAALRRLCYPDVLFPRLPLRCVGTSSISLASAWRQKLSHFAVPPFPTKSLILWGPHKSWAGVGSRFPTAPGDTAAKRRDWVGRRWCRKRQLSGSGRQRFVDSTTCAADDCQSFRMAAPVKSRGFSGGEILRTVHRPLVIRSDNFIP